MKIKNIFWGLALLSATFTCDAQSAKLLFKNIKPLDAYKAQTEHNPILVQRFGADPYAMVYDGRVYIYMTDDILEYNQEGKLVNNSYSKIHKISCVSSADLVNWQDHGAMNVAGNDGICKYARCSWAPTACHNKINGKDKFFLYFADGGNGIAVACSDTPYGPWTDPRGNGIITRQTPTCAEVTWLFDPAVLVDDNGDGYLYFGGGIPFVKDDAEQNKKNAADPGTARVAKLSQDMISIEGSPEQIRPPYLFEDAGANKINGKYYYSYCTNFSGPADNPGMGRIAYMTSENPMGPFTYQKTFFNNPGDFFGTGGNNHHSMFEFEGNYYLAYHAQKLQDNMGLKGGYRSTHIDNVTIGANGEIQSVKGTLKGVEQTKSLDPFNQVEFETMAWMSNITTEYKENSTNMVLNTKKNGAWIGLSGVDFKEGASRMIVHGKSISKVSGIKIVADNPNGKEIGYVTLTPGTETFSAKIKTPAGKHDLFLIFYGEMQLDNWRME